MRTEQDGQPRLFDLDEQQRYERFDRLQQRMPSVWAGMRLNAERESVVVIPSVDRSDDDTGSLTQADEERFLFLLLLLRQPRLHMVYVTSMPVAPAIVEYYLALLPGVIPRPSLPGAGTAGTPGGGAAGSWRRRPCRWQPRARDSGSHAAGRDRLPADTAKPT